MKFYLQDEDSLDFIWTMKQAKKWWDWWKPKEGIMEFVDSPEASNDICPIGSLEFVLDYYKRLGISDLHPLNVPDYLFQFSIGYNNGSRKVKSIDGWLDEMVANSAKMRGTPLETTRERLKNHVWRGGIYVKSETKFKHPGNGLYGSIGEFMESSGYDPSDSYQVTSFDPEISDEWRYFVYDQRVVGVKCYLPDDMLSPKVPDKEWVLDKIRRIDLPAYTLDVAMSNNPNVKTPKILEVHDFFSCGLYGFNDYSIIPYMFYRSHLKKIQDHERKKNSKGSKGISGNP